MTRIRPPRRIGGGEGGLAPPLSVLPSPSRLRKNVVSGSRVCLQNVIANDVTPNHLPAIRAIRIRFRFRKRSRAHISQIFFHRRFCALRASRLGPCGAARALRSGLMRRHNVIREVAKPLVESLFCAFSKFCALGACALRRKTCVTSRRRSRAHNRWCETGHVHASLSGNDVFFLPL
jgi:hypothetical protein